MKNLIFDVQRFAEEMKKGTYSESGTAAERLEYDVVGSGAITQTGSYVDVTNTLEPAYNKKNQQTNTVTFTNKGAFVSYTGNEGIDNITNNTERKNIKLESEVTLDGGAGDDVITNIAGGKASLVGGEGNDKITSSGENTVIDGGEGNDTITLNYTTEKIYGMSQGHYGHGTSISGGEGNDKISVVAGTENVIIDGGAGTNTIYAGNGENTIIINAEDQGQNVIYGLNENTKLNITGEIWGKQVSGSDYVFNVSPTSSATDTTTTVTLKAAAGADLNLILNGKAATLSATQTPNSWTVENGTAKYGTDIETLITITGLSTNASAAHLSLDGTVVTVSDAALNKDNTVAISGTSGKTAYTLALSSDVTAVETVENNWDLKKTKGIAIYHAGTSTNGYALSSDKKSISFVNDGDNVSATITGLSSDMTESDFTYNDGTITIAANALGNKNVSVVSDDSVDVSIHAADDAPTADSWAAKSWVVRGDVASYYIKKGNLDSYADASDGKTITYTKASNSTPACVLSGVNEGVNTTDLVATVNTKNVVTAVKVGASALDSTKTITEDVGSASLSLGANVAASVKSVNTAAKWDYVNSGTTTTATYVASHTSKGYAVTSTKKSIVYNQESGGETLAVLEGLKGNVKTGVTTKNNVITVAKAALPTADTVQGGDLVTLTSGAGSYTLALSGVTLSKVTADVLTFKGTTATYDGTSTSAGYYVDGSVVKYTPLKKSDHVVISGLKKGASKKNVSVDGYKITLSKAALSTTNVKVNNDDFQFALGEDVDAPVASVAAWEKGSIKVGKTTENAMIYKSAGTSAGYTVSTVGGKSEVVYTKAVAQTNLAVIQNYNDSVTASSFTTSSDNKISFAGSVFASGGAKVSVATADAYSFALTSAGVMTNIGAAGVSLTGASGNKKKTVKNTISGGAKSNDTIIGGDFADDSLIAGAGGNNYIDGGTGNDTLTGGAGNDTLQSSAGTNKFDGGAGNDLLIGGSGVDNMSGGAGNDSIIAGAGNDILEGGAGNDYIDGGAGNDNLNGDAGNDTLFGGDGNDTLQGTAGVNYLDGGKGNDKLIGGSGVDTLNGGDGNDTASGGAGNDIINGGAGNDSLVGEAGNDTIFGDAGNDILEGGAGNDLLWGGEATVVKGVGGDTLKGDAGNDTLVAWEGTSTLYGGDGNDVFVCSILDATTATIADFAGADKVAIDYFGAIDSITTKAITGSSNVDLIIGLKDTVAGNTITSSLTVSNVATNQAFGVTDLATNKAVANYTAKYNEEKKTTDPDTGDETTETVEVTKKFTFKTVQDWIDYGNLLPSIKAYASSESGLWFDDDSEFVTAGNVSEITKSESVLVGEVEPNALYSNLMQTKKEIEVYASK